jgi:hypothetical protein
MNVQPMRLRIPALLAAAALVLPAGSSEARPRKRAASGKAAPTGAACGVKILPLVQGQAWTYAPIVAPLPPPDAVKRIAPHQPKEITITVKSVEAKAGETVVTLEEKFTLDRTRDEKKPILEERSITTTITCSDKRFDISPDSFFFAGEPGGYSGLELTRLERLKGTSLLLAKGAIGENEWREDLRISWKQTPTPRSEASLASGTLELERQLTPQNPEPVTTKIGMYRAEKLGLITTGRVLLDHASPSYKPMELPANWISQLWLAEGIGLIQALNSFGHMYQLVDTLAPGEQRKAPETK